VALDMRVINSFTFVGVASLYPSFVLDGKYGNTAVQKLVGLRSALTSPHYVR
jgi:hypothetical protein